MPNAFAYLVLLSWPIVAILMFAAQPPARALSSAVIVGYLLLPERVGLNLPMIPTIDKVLVINLTAAVVMSFALRRQRQIAGQEDPQPPGRARWLFGTLIVLMLATPFVTVLTNGEPVIAGPLYIPGLRLYDSVSLMMSTAIAIVPFVLGMRVLGTVEAQIALLRILVVAASAYTLLALFEMRMSPQLSNWIYGNPPESFIQHIRDGKFRPLVFLAHGLSLGLFLSMAVLGACALWQQALRAKVQAAPWLAAALWLAMVLVLSRNLGATSLMLLFAPLILFTPPRQQLVIAAFFAGTVLVYPMLRGAGLVPIETIHAVAQSVSEERAGSLKYRLDNEDALLSRANEKPFAGWGSWGRNRIYDPQTGRDLSVTDGTWIITIGNFGWLGYLAQYGLIAMSIMILARKHGADLAPATAGLCLLTVTALIDSIPNTSLTPLAWLFAGALAGTCLSVRTSTPAARNAGSSRASVPVRIAADSVDPLKPTLHGSVSKPYRHRRTARN